MSGSLRLAVLAGGTGGARLARGLASVMDEARLTVVTNTADDDVFFGLLVCPDTDSVLYHLAGCHGNTRGWGVEGDTFNALAMMTRLGEPGWFQLGDMDIGVQLVRARSIREGMTLTEAVADLAERLGVRCAVVPMCDDPVRTRVRTDAGELRFQEWFVRERCLPPVRGIRYEGVDGARPGSAAVEAIAAADAVVVGPSNPFLSIDPITTVLGDALRDRRVVVVSPLVGGKALKGPTATMMEQLGEDASAYGIARHYAGVATDIVIDAVDAALEPSIAGLGMRVHVLDTVMGDEAGESRLAGALLSVVAG